MKRRLARLRYFLVSHQEVIALGLITIPVIYIQQKDIQSKVAFLAEKGLLNEYYQTFGLPK